MLAGALVGLVGAPVACILYVGAFGPDTKVVPGRQVPGRYLETITSLGLLEAGEEIRYFYSDALVDIENGMYFFTDRKVVLYCCDWAEPGIQMPFTRIARVEAEFDDSFLGDSVIVLTLDDRTDLTFPVSSEGGGDRRFFRALKQTWADVVGRPAATSVPAE